MAKICAYTEKVQTDEYFRFNSGDEVDFDAPGELSIKLQFDNAAERLTPEEFTRALAYITYIHDVALWEVEPESLKRDPRGADALRMNVTSSPVEGKELRLRKLSYGSPAVIELTITAMEQGTPWVFMWLLLHRFTDMSENLLKVWINRPVRPGKGALKAQEKADIAEAKLRELRAEKEMNGIEAEGKAGDTAEPLLDQMVGSLSEEKKQELRSKAAEENSKVATHRIQKIFGNG